MMFLFFLTTLFVQCHDLIDLDAADEVTADKDKVGGDDAVSVNIAQGITRGKCLLCGDDGCDLHARAGMAVARLARRGKHLSQVRERMKTDWIAFLMRSG